MTPSTGYRESRALASEMKFLISSDVAESIRAWARERMEADPNASGPCDDTYRTCSLYLDTPAQDVFFRRGSFGRSKYRVRRYGEGANVFLERKLKTRGMVGKRRTLVSVAELSKLEQDEDDREWVARWFLRRMKVRGLRTVCEVSYERTARVGWTSNGPIRLTLDEGLEGVVNSGTSFLDRGRIPVLDASKTILELKYREVVPVLFKELIEAFRLQSSAFSKYRAAAVSLGLASLAGGEQTEKPTHSCLTN